MSERILWNVVQTHLVHITGPLHDVLEGAFAGDVVHQEDSLDGRREEEKQKRTFSVPLIWNKDSTSMTLFYGVTEQMNRCKEQTSFTTN